MNAPGFWEIAFLAVLALMIFGPQKLPEVARNAGKLIARFKREATNTLDELKRSADLEDISGVAKELRATTADLKRSASLTGPLTSSAHPKTSAPATVRADTSPPFDPEAT